MALDCPNCGEEKLSRYRYPKRVGDKVFRRHRCLNCRRICVSVQRFVSGANAERLLDDWLDSKMEPNASSVSTHSAAAGSARAVPASQLTIGLMA